MDELEIMLSHLRDADASAEAAAISRPERSKAVEGVRQQLADLLEAVEALTLVR